MQGLGLGTNQIPCFKTRYGKALLPWFRLSTHTVQDNQNFSHCVWQSQRSSPLCAIAQYGGTPWHTSRQHLHGRSMLEHSVGASSLRILPSHHHKPSPRRSSSEELSQCVQGEQSCKPIPTGGGIFRLASFFFFPSSPMQVKEWEALAASRNHLLPRHITITSTNTTSRFSGGYSEISFFF